MLYTQRMSKKGKLAMIGIDGGTFTVLTPLIQMGVIPNISRCTREGLSSILKSTIPPSTVPAWYSLVTGLNPGRLGVLGFLDDKGNIVDSSIIKGRAIWDYLNMNGLKSLVVNFPAYPPLKLRGYFVSGMIVPSRQSFTYPRDLKNIIAKIVPDYILDIVPNIYVNFDKMLRKCITAVEQKRKIIEYFLENEVFDFSFIVFTETDRIFHVLWHKLIIKENYLCINDRILNKLFIDFWSVLDSIIELFIKKFENLVIVSDHGFTGVKGVFYINEWLALRGYIYQNNLNINYMLGFIMDVTRKLMLKYKLIKIFSSFLEKTVNEESIRRAINRINKAEESNFRKTNSIKKLAYSYSSEPTTGQIYIEHPRNDIKREIIQKVAQDLKREFGNKICIYAKEELYRGTSETLSKFPDIIVHWSDWSYIISSKIRPFYYRRKYLDNDYYIITGTHHIDGIFIAYGSNFQESRRLSACSIYDVTPTILRIYGIDISDIVDGKILTTLLSNIPKVKCNVRSIYQSSLSSRIRYIRERLKRPQ